MDDLTKIKGIGAALAKKFQDVGISSFSEMADMSDSQAKVFDEQLALKGRITRNEYREQAAALAGSAPEVTEPSITEDSGDDGEITSKAKAPKASKGKSCTARVTLYKGSTPKTFSVGDEIPSGYADSPENHPHEER